MTLALKSNGRVDGFVVEGPTAGGHSARAGVGVMNVDGQQCPLQFYLDNTPIDNESLVALQELNPS